MDLDATADTTRTDQAFHDFLAAVEHLPGGDRSTAHRSQELAGTTTTSTDTSSGHVVVLPRPANAAPTRGGPQSGQPVMASHRPVRALALAGR